MITHIARFLTLFLLALCLNMASLNIANAQDQVRIQIDGGHDFIYDGKRIQFGSSNAILGKGAGETLTGQEFNVYVGLQAGARATKSLNTFVGANSGFDSQGERNVFIGYDAGRNESRSNKLYISNTSTSTPLILGDFIARRLTINDYLDVNKDLKVLNGLDVLGHTTMTSATVSSNANITGNTTIGGDVILTGQTGTESEAIFADETGKLTRKPKVLQSFNSYNVYQTDSLSGAVRYRLGVSLEDGIEIKGLKSFVLDNEPGINTGVHNTPYVSIERQSQLLQSAPLEEIYRVEGINTADDVFVELSSTNSIGTDREIVDNSNYIYYLEIFMCHECDFRSVTILE